MSDSYWHDRLKEEEEKCHRLNCQLANLTAPVVDLLKLIDAGDTLITRDDVRVQAMRAALDNPGYDMLRERQRVDELIEKHSELAQGAHYFSDSLAQRVEWLLNGYNSQLTKQLQHAKALKEDLLVWLRAFSMLVESAGSAATHSEKNARLRGLSELVESCVETVRASNWDLIHQWRMADAFRSDLPTRAYLDRIHELEQKLKELNPQEAKPGESREGEYEVQ